MPSLIPGEAPVPCIWPAGAASPLRRTARWFKRLLGSLKWQFYPVFRARWVPRLRRSGSGPLRIFAAFHHFNAEDFYFQPALEHFGEVLRFEWGPTFNEYDMSWHWGGKQWMNYELLRAVQEAHAERPIDFFFAYVSGRTVFPSTIRAIGMMGIPTVNVALDDRLKFVSGLEATGLAGNIDLASVFTLCWTNAQEVVARYEAAGGHAIYMPQGVNPEIFHPYDVPRDIDISFVGQKYGQRPRVIAYLREHGLDVQAFGSGWGSGEIPVEEMVRIYSRSRISLGIGTMANTTDVVTIKGRDFEVPMSGGFYLTQCNPDLEEFYAIGKEIVCYTSFDDLVEKARYYLAHPDEAEQIREAGLRRARRDHTLVQRFHRLFEALQQQTGIPFSELLRTE